MITEYLFANLLNLLDLILVFSIPTWPTEIFEYIYGIIPYLQAGVGIIANYTFFPYLWMLMGIVITIDVSLGIYYVVLWIYKKIPMAGS